jgi:tRNA 2-thiouridine synthesizing protein A
MATHTLDARGWKCPLPVVKASARIKTLTAGDTLIIESTDPGSVPDVKSWASMDARIFVESQTETKDPDGSLIYRHVVRKMKADSR